MIYGSKYLIARKPLNRKDEIKRYILLSSLLTEFLYIIYFRRVVNNSLQFKRTIGVMCCK